MLGPIIWTIKMTWRDASKHVLINVAAWAYSGRVESKSYSTAVGQRSTSGVERICSEALALKFSIRHESEDFLHLHLSVQPPYRLKKRLLSRDRLLASLPVSNYCRPLIEEDRNPWDVLHRLAKRSRFPPKSKSDYSGDLCFDDRGWQQQARAGRRSSRSSMTSSNVDYTKTNIGNIPTSKVLPDA